MSVLRRGVAKHLCAADPGDRGVAHASGRRDARQCAVRVPILRSAGSDAQPCVPLSRYSRTRVQELLNRRSSAAYGPDRACLSSTSRCRCNVRDVRPPRALRFASPQAITPTHAPLASRIRSSRSPPVNGAWRRVKGNNSLCQGEKSPPRRIGGLERRRLRRSGCSEPLEALMRLGPGGDDNFRTRIAQSVRRFGPAVPAAGEAPHTHAGGARRDDAVGAVFDGET